MAIRHPFPRGKALPTLWLLTDERMGERLWDAIDRLPRGSGILFRHLVTPVRERKALLTRIEGVARRRRLLVVEAGRHRPVSIHPAHSVREAVAARRARADLILVSPVYPTNTHPGARTLGPLRAARIARSVPTPALALGGVTRVRFRRMKALGFAGWAAIDGLMPDQKRNAVPI